MDKITPQNSQLALRSQATCVRLQSLRILFQTLLLVFTLAGSVKGR
jgi:hypothetical protein